MCAIYKPLRKLSKRNLNELENDFENELEPAADCHLKHK